jgi:phenylacetate-CoA ligase
VSVDECPEGSYHVTESGILEVVRDGEQVSDGEIGEIIGTGLYNYSMPLIRYRTTDICRHSGGSCSCGRGMPLVQSLEGRTSDTILASEGKIVTGMSFEHYWKHEISPFTPHLDYVHVIQRFDKRILVKMVKKEGYSDEETMAIIRGLNSLLGPDIQVEFEELNAVPAQRKWRFTESELNVCLI